MSPDVPQPVLDYLDSQRTVTLATASSDGVPHAATFMYVHDGLSLYFWARPTSTTAKHVEANSRVAFAIDEYIEDWNKAKGIQGDGGCNRISDGDEVARAVGLFADKFPSPSSGASTTNISFFKVSPTSMQFIDNSGSKIEMSDEEFGMDFKREQVLSG